MLVSSAELRMIVPQSEPLFKAAADGTLPVGHPVFITGDDGCFQLAVAKEVAHMLSGNNVHVLGMADVAVRTDVLAASIDMPTIDGGVGSVVLHSGVFGIYDKIQPYIGNSYAIFVGPEGTCPCTSALKFSFQWMCKDHFYNSAMRYIYTEQNRRLPMQGKPMTDLLWNYSGGCPELLMATMDYLRVCRSKNEVYTFMEQQKSVVSIADKLVNVLYAGDIVESAEEISNALESCQWRPLLPHVMGKVQDSVLMYPEASLAAGMLDVLAMEVTTEAQFVTLCLRLAKVAADAKK